MILTKMKTKDKPNNNKDKKNNKKKIENQKINEKDNIK